MKAFLASRRATRCEAALQTGVTFYSSTPGPLNTTRQMRRPLYGAVTIVGREEAVTKSCFPSPPTAATAQKPSAALRLLHRFGVQPRPILFDGHGVPVDGSLVTLPAKEQLRLVVAMLLALLATKTAYDALRYECVYHEIWNAKWRHSADAWQRTGYYAGCAAATVGLSWLYSVTFLAAATIAGRNRLAARWVYRSAAHVLPRRTCTSLARRLHV